VDLSDLDLQNKPVAGQDVVEKDVWNPQSHSKRYSKGKHRINQSAVAENALAAGAEALAEIDCAELGIDSIVIQGKAVFGSSPDGTYVIEVWNSSDGGTTVDNVTALATLTFNQAGGATVIQSVKLEGYSHLTLKRKNNNSSEAVTETIIYSAQ